MATESANLEFVDRYLRAIEQGAVGDELAAFFVAEVVQEEFPNRLVERGARPDLAALLEGAQRGQQVMSAQRYEVRNTVASADQVALEVVWTGTLAVPLGSLAAGETMRAQIAMFIEFRDRKIAAQRNYDCYDPW